MLQCSIFLLIGDLLSKLLKSLFLNKALFKATRMTRAGNLMDVSKLIQRTLLRSVASPLFKPAPAVKRSKGPAAKMPRAANDALVDAPSRRQPGPAQRTRESPTFVEKTFTFSGERYPYRLFTPSTPQGSDASSLAPMPLVVLLHGCKQNAQDFARGTAMNALAEKHQCMVLYPEQIAKANSQRCWNWFERGHQRLDTGEPGMIAALTRQVLSTSYDGRLADPTRVYVAGLSAGGAMAAVVAGLYPDIFAAVGVHSGLPAGAARNLVSAFGAMQRGAKGLAPPALPTIVFHGSADKTVHPDNGAYISDAALAALTASGLSLVKSSSKLGAANQSSTERIVYRTADGPSYVEYWRVNNGPHAWSGGDAAGSYTDPDGPSASAAMLAFFLQHKR